MEDKKDTLIREYEELIRELKQRKIEMEQKIGLLEWQLENMKQKLDIQEICHRREISTITEKVRWLHRLKFFLHGKLALNVVNKRHAMETIPKCNNLFELCYILQVQCTFSFLLLSSFSMYHFLGPYPTSNLWLILNADTILQAPYTYLCIYRAYTGSVVDCFSPLSA